MLLKRCHVQGFGKLQDFTYEFSEGFNVICAENGWGKSTFAAFLRAMFYGLPQTNRKNIEEAERRKYKPWNGEVMGGSLVFEVNGKEYRAERTFGKKEAEDTFRLIDLTTNLDTEDFTEELGKELFGLDKEAYSRSTYLPQNKIYVEGMNDSIGKKLGKMAEGEEDGGNYDRAFETLEELRKKYIPDRQKDEKGYVAELKHRLSEARAGLERCRRKWENAKPWRDREQSAAVLKKETEEQLADCREKLKSAAGYEALAEKKRTYTELCGREESLRIKKESMQGLFRAGIPEVSELRRCRRAAEEASVLAGELRSYRLDSDEQYELNRLQYKFENGMPDREEIQECIRLVGETKEELYHTEQLYRREEEKAEHGRKMKNRYTVLAVLFLLLAIGCGIFAFCGKDKTTAEGVQTEIIQVNGQKEETSDVNTVMLGLCGVFVFVFFGMVVIAIRAKKEIGAAQESLANFSTEIELLRTQGEQGRTLLKQYNAEESEDVTGALYRLAEETQQYGVLFEKKEKQERCIAQRDALLQGCNELLAQYGMESEDVSGSLHILENRTGEFLRISEEYAEAVKKREQFERVNSPESFYGLVAPEISFLQLQQTEQELLERIARATEEEKDCRDRAEAFEEGAEAEGELEALCAELEESLEAKQREHGLIVQTRDCLKKAKELFSSRYLHGLTTGFEKYVKLLGDKDLEKSMAGQFGSVQTDIDLNIQVTAYGEKKELGYFSTGTRDLMGLCMRFALVDAMFSEERPFLVLDDPFVNLDKEKTERAVTFLKEAAEHYQILYLVCHESRA